MNTATKTVMIALIIVSAAMMSGCLDSSGTAKEDVTIERMVQLEAILTDPEISEEEKIAAYTLAHEAITGEKHELDTEVNLTPVEIERKIVGVTVRQEAQDVIVTIQGGEDYDTLKEIEVLVNNRSLGTYPAEYQIENKIECNIIGEWEVRVDGAFTDSTIQTLIDTRFNGLRELNRDIPTSKPTLTSTKVTPTITPTITSTIAIPEPDPELPDYYIRKLDIAVDKLQWDDSVIAFVRAASPDCWYVNDNVENIKFYIDGKLVATIKPSYEIYPLTYNHQFTDSRLEFRNPMLIKLPPGTTSNGEITAILSVYNMDLGVENGEYPYRVEIRTPPEQHKEKYNAYPYNTDWL